MSQDTAVESIVERVDGIRVDSADLSGVAEVEVTVDESDLPDEIKQVRSWVENAVESYIEKEFREAGYKVRCQARASDITEDDPVLYSDLEASESKYSVWLQFEKSNF
ncbi:MULTISPECIES: hypothetical protein [Halolamina]|uniref:hypothetical protein n=1 Tax=Halolamina TaxID=1075397 RepID=UPI001160776B|nr:MULTISPECIES: hypothetical protein [Halolamina]NHX37277.1 hypothetical protein [Halolamina sp. R1-12]